MSGPEPTPFTFIRKLLPYTTIAAVIALFYVAWVFYSRVDTNKQIQKAADEKSVEQAQKTYEMYGSGQLKILMFYATPATVARGQATQLCYGVSNATTVRIDNGIEEIKPSLNRCVPAKPAKSTSYTITATDDKGHEATQTIDVGVR
jgi:hypothetical protein